MKGCSEFCKPNSDDPACRMCRKSLDGSPQERLKRVLADAELGLRIYIAAIGEVRSLPWSLRITENAQDAREAALVALAWVKRHLEAVEKRSP